MEKKKQYQTGIHEKRYFKCGHTIQCNNNIKTLF